MRRISLTCFLSIVVIAPAIATPAPIVRLWRLDCGAIQIDNLNEYSDTFAYIGQTKLLAVSCYLIQHGDTYMLWDTGLPEADLGLPLKGRGSTGETLSRTIRDQLLQVKLSPSSISIVGISHYHYDHTGQAGDFPQARLLLGQADVEVVRKPGNENAKPLEHWISGGGRLEPVVGDKDIFEDSSVVMLNLPGHTPGHHGLLIKLQKTGCVLLSGDVAHFRENYTNDGVPPFNYDRAQSLASLGRFKKIAVNLNATVVIQHEQDDIAKLPEFPKFAD